MWRKMYYFNFLKIFLLAPTLNYLFSPIGYYNVILKKVPNFQRFSALLLVLCEGVSMLDFEWLSDELIGALLETIPGLPNRH